MSLYRRFTAVGAVLHVHAPAATTLSALVGPGGELRLEGWEMLKALDGVTSHEHVEIVPVVENDQDIVRLASRAGERLDGLPGAHAYLIAGHGLYSWGRSVGEARRHVEALEHLFDCELRRMMIRGLPATWVGPGGGSSQGRPRWSKLPCDRPPRPRRQARKDLMLRKRAAIVLGASGSVGNALVKELFSDGSFDPVITLSRRSLPDALAIARAAGRTLREQIVPEMNAAAARAGGPAIVSVFRPGMIIGSQHTPWIVEKALPLFSFLTPRKFKSISVGQIAKAMTAAAKDHPATSEVYHYPEMMALIR